MKDWVLKVDLKKPTLVVAPGHLHLTLLEALNGLSFLPDFDLMTRESWRHQHTTHLTKDAPLKLVSQSLKYEQLLIEPPWKNATLKSSIVFRGYYGL